MILRNAYFSFASVLVLAFATTAQSIAQDRTLDILAIVNDSVITEYDLDQRLRLVISNSGLENTSEVRRNLRGQVLDQLIEEMIKLQEAEKQAMLPPRQNAVEGFERIAQGNNISPEQLETRFENIGLNKETLITQIHANLAWQAVLRRAVAPTLQVSESEIDFVLTRIQEVSELVQMNLAEIFIAKDDPRQHAQKRQLAQDIANQLNAGGNFGSLASQFSQSPTATNSGRMGWRVMAEFEPAIVENIEALQKGQISNIIETTKGFHIFLVLDRKSNSLAADQTMIDLAQIQFPYEAETPEAQTKAETQASGTRQIRGCPAFLQAAERLNTPGSGSLGQIPLGSLSTQFRTVIADLPEGQPSKPIRLEQGLAVFMVCERVKPELDLPSRDQIKLNILNDRMAVAARRYMRDLTRDANIELR